MSVLQGPMRGPMGGSMLGGSRPAAVAGLPDPWLSTDIGSVGLAGSASYADSTFTINGAGADIWGTADSFNFLYRSLSGDGTLTARIVTLDGWDFYEAAGLMVRETLDVGSKAGFAKLRYGSGFGVQYRDTTDGTHWTSDYDAYGAPYWIVHRADLQGALAARVTDHPDIALRLGAQVEDVGVDVPVFQAGQGAAARRTIGVDTLSLALPVLQPVAPANPLTA